MATIAFELYGDLNLRTTQFNKDLAKVKTNLNATMSEWNKNIGRFSSSFNKLAKPIMTASKAYAVAATGLAAKALNALYNSNTKQGKAWKSSLTLFRNQMNAEMARIGSNLLKIPIFGSTIPKWMDKFIQFLRSIDLSKLEKMVKLFEAALVTITAIKAAQIGLGIAQGLTGLGKLLSSSGVAAKSVKAAKATKVANTVAEDISATRKMQTADTVITALGVFGYVINTFKTLISNISIKLKRLFMSGTQTNILDKLPKSDWISLKDIAKKIKKGGIVGPTVGQKITSSLGKGILISTLISTLFYGWKDILEGVKIALKAYGNAIIYVTSIIRKLIDPLNMVGRSIAWVKKNETLKATGAIIKDFGALPGGTAAGIGGALGAISTGDFKGAGKAFSTAAESFFTRNVFKDKVWQKPDLSFYKEEMGKGLGITGQYMGITEGVKFAQDTQKREQDQVAYLKSIAENMQKLAQEAKN